MKVEDQIISKEDGLSEKASHQEKEKAEDSEPYKEENINNKELN